MTISARSLLTRQLQEFFETHLVGLYRWSHDTALRAGERGEKIPGRRQLDKEVVVVDFDGYALMVHSTTDAPPLGKIVLVWFQDGAAQTLDGPLDVTTWDRAAEAIKNFTASRKGLSHVDD